MSASFEIDEHELVDLSRGLETIPVAMRRNLLNAANATAVKGVSLARVHVPVWQGELRDDIHATPPILSEDGITVTVLTDKPYAATMEEGRRPGAKMPPKGALLAWMASKGIDPAQEFVLRRAIAINGIPGHFFMKYAFDQLSAGIAEQNVVVAIEKTLAGFGGAT